MSLIKWNAFKTVMTDRELIEGCIRGDRNCQKALFEKFAGKMKVVCMRYVNNHDDAEDVLQEGFIKVFKYIAKFSFEGSFEGWIRRIMVNAALTKITRHSYKEEVAMVHTNMPVYDYGDVIADMSAKELKAHINALPDGYRLVFNMYVIEGFSHKEIAESLHISEATSRSQLLKARLALQQKLKKNKITYSHAG
ncbi:MAG TPA: sigma-70 family RNA polymerase sigma factor [Bacteroidia bacterium]|nr:sigma-70 family RNA polymerase sigma factor [Bacteroidia bacterium]HMU20395.1 sigma-70 family RNA polymerase sigma factor [Bacteroidia bacterium]